MKRNDGEMEDEAVLQFKKKVCVIYSPIIMHMRILSLIQCRIIIHNLWESSKLMS